MIRTRVLHAYRLAFMTMRRTRNTMSSVSSPPTRLILERSRRAMTIDKLMPGRLQEAFQLVSDAAEKGDNVGVDEYPTITYLERLVERSNAALGLRADDDGRLTAVVIATPCIYARSPRPTLCTLVVVTSLSGEAWRDVIDVAMDTVARLPEAYSACVVNMFVTCVGRLLTLREAGFIITACIPYAGKVAGFPDYVNNYVMYKDLGTVPQPPAPFEPEAGSMPTAAEAVLIDTPSMPINHTMSDGTELTVRCMRHDDVQLFYDALKSVAESGFGYGQDELPNMHIFLRDYINGFRNFVVEHAQTGELVGYFNVGGPSIYARSAHPVILDGGNALITPKYQRRNFYVEFCTLQPLFLDAVGGELRGYQGDTAVVNIPTNLSLVKINYIPNGILPRAIYFSKHGWVDLVLCFRPKLSSSAVISKL